MLEVVTSIFDVTWILTGLIGLVTLFLVRHMLQVRSLPPGPLPLPILGNLLKLRGKGNEFANVVARLQKKHKDIFTLWLGSRPTIFVCCWELCHEALIVKRNDFAGRVKRSSTEVFLHGHEDVALTDFGPTWETLRKILSTAVRKYVASEKLAELCCDVCDMTAEEMIKQGKPVDSREYMYLIIYNILASSTFGQRFEFNDPKFTSLRSTNEEFNEKFGVGLPSDAVPLLTPLYRRRINEIAKLSEKFTAFIEENFRYHLRTYQDGDIRDFTDAIIASREEAKAENRDSLKYLTEGNMVMVLNDLFGAGTDTTRVYMMWILLIVCDRPEIQKKMQAEIDVNIGSRLPSQKDKSSCPYVTAVMTEVLRFRPVIDFSLEHQTTCDTELAGYKIPKHTSCMFYIKGSHYDTECWEEPDKFKPERFLDADGKFINTRMVNYMPFGLGRRACPGEKLAIADTFLCVARLLQKHDFALENGPGSVTLEPRGAFFSRDPVSYKLVVKKRIFTN